MVEFSQRVLASSCWRFLDHTQRRTTVGRTPLDERSIRRRDNTQHSKQTIIHAPGGNRTHNLSGQAAEDLRLRQRGHWDRQSTKLILQNDPPDVSAVVLRINLSY